MSEKHEDPGIDFGPIRYFVWPERLGGGGKAIRVAWSEKDTPLWMIFAANEGVSQAALEELKHVREVTAKEYMARRAVAEGDVPAELLT